MTRHVVTLANDRLRDRAVQYIRDAKPMSRVEVKGPKRSTDQNGAMWAMLGDVVDLRECPLVERRSRVRGACERHKRQRDADHGVLPADAHA